MSLCILLIALAALQAVQAQVQSTVGGGGPLINTFGACSMEAGTQFTNADIALIYNVADAQSCCQFCQGFSTISAVPCGAYSFCASCPDGKANVCALKEPGTMSKTSTSAYTSGAVSVVRNFSSNVVVPPPVQNGSCQIIVSRYLWDKGPYVDDCSAEYLENKLNVESAQDCCSYCAANPKCNMFDSTEAFKKCTVSPDGIGTWSAGIIEGRDPPPESRRLRLRM
ncbi:hypothetical protein ABPG75_005361 [Micractinium tetrahymenae]